MRTHLPRPTVVQLAEARVIAAAEKAGVEWQEVARALKLPRSTYFDRRRLAARLKARRDDSVEAAYTRAEAGCR